MPTISFRERPKSRKSTENPRSITLSYVLQGIADDALARAYARAATAALYDGLYRQDISLDPQGGGLWYVDVPYGPRKEAEPADYRWQFDTTGGTAKITQSLGTDAYAPPGETAPDHGGAIGVSKDGQPEGVEVLIPAFKWTEDWTFSASAVDWTYSQILKALTGRINDDTFRGFDAGTVRFDGAQGGYSNKDPELVQLTFHFTQSDDVSNIVAGDLTVTSKPGWSYLWYLYDTEKDATAGRLRAFPIAAYVEEVYQAADFELLGIGT
jgi:hypothetical protein